MVAVTRKRISMKNEYVPPALLFLRRVEG